MAKDWSIYDFSLKSDAEIERWLQNVKRVLEKGKKKRVFAARKLLPFLLAEFNCRFKGVLDC